MYRTSNAFDFGKPVAYDAAAKRLNLTEEGRSALIPLLDRGVIDIAVVLGAPAIEITRI